MPLSPRGTLFADWCQPFYRAGYQFFPLKVRSKTPRDVGWQTRKVSEQELGRWVATGGNVGVLLSAQDVVLDVDPRSGGLEAFGRLQRDLGIDLSNEPTILSGRGDGGRHIYLTKPQDLRVSKGIEGYPGIDIKTKGGFVVGPASRHPETGALYRPDPNTPNVSEVAEAPASLLAVLRRSAREQRVQFGGGELTIDDLALTLSVLDPAEYGDGNYARWIRLAAACHDATGGDGLEVWLAWAALDDRYNSEADYDRNIATWSAFKAGRPGGANYLTLLWEVARAGRADISRRLEPALRFELNEPLANPGHTLSFDEED